MRRVLSWKRLLIVLGVLVTLSAATYGVHAVQNRRHATALKERAAKAAEASATDPAKAEEAISLLEQYLKFRPRDEEAFHRYSTLMFAQAKADPKQASAAAEAGEKFLRQFPDHPDDRRKLIDLYVDLGRLMNARQHIQIMFDTRPELKEDVDLLDKAATCELGLGGDVGQAVRYLDTAVQTKKAPPRVFERLLGMLYGKNAYSDPRYTPAKYLEVLLNEEPYRSDIAARVVAGRFMLLSGETQNARKHITDAITNMRDGATDADALMALAELELAEIKTSETIRAQLKKAEAHLQTAFTAHKKNVRVGLMLAQVLTEEGEVKQAIEVLRTSADALGGTNDEFLLVVDRLLDLGEQDLSRTLIDRIATNEADRERIVKYLRGRMALLKGNWATARTNLEEIAPALVRVRDFHKKAMYGIGRCYGVLQNPDKQMECYSAALQDDPRYLPALIGRAEANFRLGRYREASGDYQTIVNGYGLAAYRPKLARLELRAVVKQPAPARRWDAFEKSLGPDADRTPELQILYAESLAARGDGEGAAKVLQAIVDKDPKNAAAWLALARVRGGGSPDGAVKLLDEAAAKIGDTVDLRLARSLVLVNRTRKPTPNEIRALAEKAENFEKWDRRRLWFGLGEAASRAALIADEPDAAALRALAIEYLQKAADLDPEDLMTRAALVDAGLAAGRPDVVDAALAGIAAVEGEKGPIGTLSRVVKQLPEVRRTADKAVRAVGIADLRALANRAKADRPGWARVYVALAQLDELEGLNDAALANYKEAIEKGERQEFVIRRAVELYRDRRQEDQAALLLNSLHTEVPLPEDLERFRAIKDLLARDIPRSERPTIDRVAPADSKDWRVLLLRGSLLATLGEDADAHAAFRAAVALGDNVPETWGAMVSHLIRIGRVEDAKRATAEAEQKLKDNPPKTDAARAELIMTLAGCYELTGDQHTALNRYQEAVNAAPRELNPTRQLVLFLQRSGKMADANKKLQGLADDATPDLARWARRHLALTMMAGADAYNQREAALKLIAPNLAASKTDPEDVKARAVVLTIDPATREEGTKTLEEFAKWGDLTPDEFLLLGRLYFDQGKVAESVTYFEKAARPRAGLSAGHLAELIRVYLGMNMLENARAAVSRLKAFAPRSWDAAREEARFLHREAAEAERVGNKEGAKKLDAQALALITTFPGGTTEPFVRTRSGPLLEELGFTDTAEGLYTRLLTEAKDPSPHLPLAALRIGQKRSADAIELAWKYKDTTPAVVTARILTGAIRARNPGPEAERKVEAWLDEKLRQSVEKWEQLALLGSKAELFDALKNYDEAIATYEKAVHLAEAARPDELKGFQTELFVNNMCVVLVLHRHREADRAIKMMSAVIGVRGPIPAYLDTRALGYLVKGGKTKEAVADLKLALIQQKRPVYLFHLAWAYAQDPDTRSLSITPREEAKKLGLAVEDLHPLEVWKFEEMYR
ncbi:MAG: tetratricopeptide repeat protein [Gemmataceae bacterium]|nr:tetratricopeptide repeat protein [Gemmataceae bacterium]